MKINRSKLKLFVFIAVIMISTALLFAMLGQLDIILAPWYCDPEATWMFPFPFIFNAEITSMLGWEIIYGLIIMAFVLNAIGFYLLGARKEI